MGSMTQSPSEVLDYPVDFSRWLESGDTLTVATSVAVTGSATASATVDVSDDTARVWLEGGADGDAAKVTVTAVTAGGRTKQHCFTVNIRNC